MKVFFTASLRGQKKLINDYQKIFETIEKLGCQNLDDFILKGDFPKLRGSSDRHRVALLRKAIKQIKKADIIVLEVSVHSLSMGYLMNRSLEEGKPVILLYKEGIRPFLPIGVEDPNLQTVPYSEGDLVAVLKDALEEAKRNVGSRFTIILSPRINSFLNRMARSKRIPRSVFIRSLIEKEMKREF